MHCQCHGCIKKINDGLKDISLSEGVESTDLLLETGEVKVTGRMDPEKLCSMLRSVTKKCVQIVTQSTLSEGPRALAQQNKNLYGQWLAKRREDQLPGDPERAAVAGGVMERDCAIGAMLVPVVGVFELVGRVGCVGDYRDAGHVRALSCMFGSP
ncbi:hypothetical protein HU200_040141 [Digitaria exilis]|uniref:HMA domain-containing protein n=1 Tax=Digitaria exilis TaxID=1010633 RepID=A0A835EJ07_9POAL|nr:hypothetical protein HU200_040141 [Digitaria exilis]